MDHSLVWTTIIHRQQFRSDHNFSIQNFDPDPSQFLALPSPAPTLFCLTIHWSFSDLPCLVLPCPGPIQPWSALPRRYPALPRAWPILSCSGRQYAPISPSLLGRRIHDFLQVNHYEISNISNILNVSSQLKKWKTFC